MPKVIKLLSPAEAHTLARRLLDQKLLRDDSCKKRTSLYFYASGFPTYKVRLSDHADTTPNTDVVHDIILNYQTTQMDVEHHVRKALEAVQYAKQNLQNRRAR